MSNRFVVVLLACIVAFGGIFWFSKHKSDSSSNGSKNSSAQPSNHIQGEGKKGVTLTEYGDYQCPACYEYYPLVKAIQQKYNSDIYFQFRNFPLPQHQNARAGHRAAEAAGKQGKYWEMHDLLYEHSHQETAQGPVEIEWTKASNPVPFLEQYAQQLGLDLTRFRQDYASSEVNDVINADIAEGTKVGADSTPTFVIDGKKVTTNPRDLDGFSKLIDAAIKAKNP